MYYIGDSQTEGPVHSYDIQGLSRYIYMCVYLLNSSATRRM